MGYLSTICILSCINIIAVLGLAILTGYTGLFSIGHSGFMAIGAHTSAILYINFHVPFFPAIALGGLAAGLASLTIGYPAFRGLGKLRGDYLGFGEAVRLLLNTTYKYVGGAYGLTEIPGLTTLPVAVGMALLALIAAHNLMRSEHGKNFLAVGQDEVAAQMMGVNLFTTKLKALFISAFYAGVAGALFGFYMTYLSPGNFGIGKSSDMLAAVVFGGMQSLIGPALAAFLLVGIPEFLRFLLDWRLVIYGVLFVVVMIYRPQGMLGNRELSFQWLWRTLDRFKPAKAGGKDTL